MRRTWLGLWIVITILLSSSGYASEQTVSLFFPQGEVKKIRQVTARFSEQMVPFSDPNLVQPFEITCQEKGRGRWVDSRNWVYDFGRDLPAGVRCDFEVKSDLKTFAGSKISGQKKFSFNTGGPSIIRSQPYEGRDIDEEQAFILALDAEAKEETVHDHAYCTVEGIREQVGVKILKGADRERLLKSQGQYYRFGISRDDAGEYSLLVVQCKQNFPSSAKVALVWGQGIESKTGVTTSREQRLSYRVRDPFKAVFSCDRENVDADCIPFLPFSLQFSSPVAREYAQAITLQGPAGTYKPVLQGYDGNENEAYAKPPEYVQGLRFSGPFPPLSSFRINLPKNMRDDAGRSLSNSDQYPLTVKTADYPPLAKFTSRFGIIERADAVLPATVRNIEAELKMKALDLADAKSATEKTTDIMIDSMKSVLFGRVLGKIKSFASETDVIRWLNRVAEADSKKSIFSGTREEKLASTFSMPKPNGAKAFEVIGIPLQETGFFVVELESVILGKSLHGESLPYFVPTAALVTNLVAHFKQSRESSLVWVTSLDKSEPVKDAVVSIRDCQGKVYWDGKTGEQGIAFINKKLPQDHKLPRCKQHSEGGYYVFARTTDDMTFVRSAWNQGIESWRFNLPQAEYRGPVLAHTITDRSLLRAGETVSLKHLVRKHTSAGFSFVKDLPKMVVIQHQGSDQRYEFPLTWDQKGIAESFWKIPRDAKLGTYTITLLKKAGGKKKQQSAVGGYEEGDEEYYSADGLLSGSFRVEEFRVPLMKGIIQPSKDPLVNAREATVDLFVKHLSGGGASGAPVKLRTMVSPRQTNFSQYDDFVFANGRVKEGIIRRGERSDDEEYGEEDEERPSRSREKTKRSETRSSELTLDANGAVRTTIKDLPKSATPQDILAEMEFRDPNGDVQTVSSRIPLWSSDVLIGIKQDSWVSSKDSFKFQVLALDLTGKPKTNQSITAELFQRKTYSHRKRLIGGFYAYEHSTETKKVKQICEGRTDAKGLLICESSSPVSGNVIIQARTADNSGNESLANRDIWIADKSEWWFDVSDNDRIDLLPEQKQYEPGETARFQVRMPFREATALVTVEREGVMEASVKKLSGKMPVIDVAMKGNYAPNVFVSVLCVRGRLGDVKPTALVDLGRPAYKLGIAEVNVGWRAHELRVFLAPEKQIYHTRDKAKIRVKVRTRDKKNPWPPKTTELAIAAVDEGLLELMPNKSWKLLDGMMGRRGYEVHTSTAQMQVVGKRHYGLKAYPAGGGGGKTTTREMFDTLLLWKGRVKLNDNGETTVEIPLNDSLTSFRIVAVANADAGLFGSGETSIRTTQDLMLLSGLPPVLREGDRYRAGFTIRNASDRKMDVEISASIKNAPAKPASKTESLSAGEAREIFWDTAVPVNIDSLVWSVSAKEKNGPATDKLRITQKVTETVQPRVLQATITQIEKPQELTIEKPNDALPAKGGIQLSLRRKLSKGLGGVTWYMKNYPYTCMEQKASRAIALRDASLWKSVTAELPALLDSDGLVKYFPTCSYGSDTLTAYLLSVSNEAGWGIPTEVKTRMLAGLQGFIEGKIVRWSSLPTADVSIRKLAALEALSRYSKAEPRLLGSITLEPNLWPTSAVIDWMNVLMRGQNIPERDAKMKEAEQIIRSRINFQGTTMGFSTEKSDYLWWLMISGDVNAVRTVLTLLDREQWKEDMPRLVRGAIGRQRHGAWNTTTANAWGVLAMEKFSKKFESVPVTGISSGTFDGKTKSVNWQGAAEGSGIVFSWPQKRAELVIEHQGTGKPWATIQSMAAISTKEPLASGYTIKKTLTPLEQKQKGTWSRGDVLRVKLDIESQADMTWVVVNDPIPAGGTILGSGLGGDSKILTKDETKTGRAWPVFTERTFTAYRAYYEYVSKGKWSLEYTVRLNTSGSFELSETRVEALYSPEMFGEIPNKKMEIGQ